MTTIMLQFYILTRVCIMQVFTDPSDPNIIQILLLSHNRFAGH